MRFKVATISMMIADVILFITSAFYLAMAPGKHATRQEAVGFVIRSYIIVAVLLLSLLVTVVLVWMWMQKLREEFREEAKINLESLIEGTLRDHGRKEDA
jgi:uncharacterized membrane protein